MDVEKNWNVHEKQDCKGTSQWEMWHNKTRSSYLRKRCTHNIFKDDCPVSYCFIIHSFVHFSYLLFILVSEGLSILSEISLSSLLLTIPPHNPQSPARDWDTVDTLCLCFWCWMDKPSCEWMREEGPMKTFIHSTGVYSRISYVPWQRGQQTNMIWQTVTSAMEETNLRVPYRVTKGRTCSR